MRNRIAVLILGVRQSRLCRLLCGKAQPFPPGGQQQKKNIVFSFGWFPESRRFSATQAAKPRHPSRTVRPRFFHTFLVLVSFGAVAPGLLVAQGLTPEKLLQPSPDTWPTYNGDYSGRRFSTLDQINSGNVSSLTLAWAFHARSASIKSTPLEVNGILYLTTPDQARPDRLRPVIPVLGRVS